MERCAMSLVSPAQPEPVSKRGLVHWTLSDATVPPEQQGSPWTGAALHLGPAVVFVVGLAVWGVTLGNVLALFFALSVVNLVVVLRIEHARPCVPLPAASARQWFDGLVLVFGKGIGVGGAVVVGGWWLGSHVSPFSGATAGLLPVLFAVMMTDYAYYWVHRSLNHGSGGHPIVRLYRRKHQLHHSVGDLDFLRGNLSSLVDTAVTGFQLPLALIATLLGLDLGHTLAAYGLVLMLQATHHVNHTFNLGVLRYFFMDNHAHKLHHCPRGMLVNHGAMFSVWDRAHGTFFEDWALSANHMHQASVALPVRRAGAVRPSG
jgi:sterol desaturase/sphingolipid hydroxylase (fatty acid hydroxylase superfamily)